MDPLLQDSRFAPFKGETAFIIDRQYLTHADEIHTDFDIDYYGDIFDIQEEVE